MILLITAIAVILTYLAGGLWLSILSGLISAFLIFISKPIWLSADHGKNLIRRISLSIIIVFSGTYFGWSPLISSLVLPIIKTHLPNVNLPSNAPPTALLIFAFGIVWVVNYLMRDKTVMRQ